MLFYMMRIKWVFWEKDDKKSDSIENHSYSDTINGDKYFLPTIYLNDLNNKYNIYKIINIYIPKKFWIFLSWKSWK